MARAALREVDESLKLRRDRHRLESADTGAARIAHRHPEPGLEQRPGDAPRLPQNLGGGVLAQTPAQHRPVHAQVLDSGGLAEHMGPLQASEGRAELAERLVPRGGIELVLDEGADPPGEAKGEVHRARTSGQWRRGRLFRVAAPRA
jgi:hypothetical protein